MKRKVPRRSEWEALTGAGTIIPKTCPPVNTEFNLPVDSLAFSLIIAGFLLFSHFRFFFFAAWRTKRRRSPQGAAAGKEGTIQLAILTIPFTQSCARNPSATA
ncbi:MAG: hypothetical protein LUF68_01430 [Clostridiales bacterium]|nr:hypothetical protein [Clostridiales bacterium]